MAEKCLSPFIPWLISTLSYQPSSGLLSTTTVQQRHSLEHRSKDRDLNYIKLFIRSNWKCHAASPVPKPLSKWSWASNISKGLACYWKHVGSRACSPWEAGRDDTEVGQRPAYRTPECDTQCQHSCLHQAWREMGQRLLRSHRHKKKEAVSNKSKSPEWILIPLTPEVRPLSSFQSSNWILTISCHAAASCS